MQLKLKFQWLQSPLLAIVHMVHTQLGIYTHVKKTKILK